jgi:membrane-associated protease RseP (regulator of RpoE activity)
MKGQDDSNPLLKSFDLDSYNTKTPLQKMFILFAGPFANFLARKDFDILHINVGAKTSNPITVIPTSLRTVTTIPEADAKITRSLTITDTNIVGNKGVSFLINHKLFDINYNNYDLPLNI